MRCTAKLKASLSWVLQQRVLLALQVTKELHPRGKCQPVISTALCAGWGMSITQPPAPRGPKGHLAFVAVRLGERGRPQS